MRIALVTTRIPYPPDLGGRIRTFHLLKNISQVACVTLITAVEDHRDEQALASLQRSIPEVSILTVKVPPRNSLQRKAVRAFKSPFDPLPYTWAAFNHPAFARHIRNVIKRNKYDIIHCDHVHVAHMFAGLDMPACILNAHNVENILIRRVAEQESGWLKRKLIMWQANKALVSERRAFFAFDRCVAVSELDQNAIERIAPGVPVSVVPNGVDLQWFRPGGEEADSLTIVAIGAMDWLPNIDSITFFVLQVLPLILDRLPQAELWVVGRNPPASLVRRLGCSKVHFTGTVADVRPYLGGASVVVVPLRIGGGTRLKILDAWAMGKAVVSTSIGAEGLPVIDGGNIILANSPGDMAARIVELLGNSNLRKQLGTIGRRLVEEHFGWDRVARLLMKAYEETIATKSSLGLGLAPRLSRPA